MATHYYYKPCSHKGCKERSYRQYSNRRDYNASIKRNEKYTCIRHSSPEKILSFENDTTESILIVVKNQNGKFWKGKDKISLSSGFVYGDGYKAFAEDFPEGTELIITAQIKKPDTTNQEEK